VEKIREGLIESAKIKRAYYRSLKREEKAGTISENPFDANDGHEHDVNPSIVLCSLIGIG
jgi:hypothetical protein